MNSIFTIPRRQHAIFLCWKSYVPCFGNIVSVVSKKPPAKQRSEELVVSTEDSEASISQASNYVEEDGMVRSFLLF